MGILNKKTWRYIVRNLGQFLAATSVVMGGIVVYIAMSSAYFALGESRDRFYEDNNFADYYFQVVKAPENVVKQIEMIDGVGKVTSRIQRDVPILKDNEERATARIVSYSLPLDDVINRFTLQQGRTFEVNQASGPTEVVLDPKYFTANQLTWGDQITVIVDGKEARFAVVGEAISPEFIYAMKDSGDILPDPLKFGIFMVEYSQAQQLLAMPGEINQVLIEFAPDADQGRVIDSIKNTLEPFGLLADYPRADQLSHAVLNTELAGLRSVTTVLPLIFLGIAAAIQFVILRRLIKAQRAQIGLMKGLGYHNYLIMFHYISYALAISLAGAVLGIILGVVLSGQMIELYATYFNLPTGLQGFNQRAIINGLAMCLAIGFIAGLSASRRVVQINPAAAMRPEPPKIGGKSLLEHLPPLWKRLDAGWKMTLRNISRNRSRFVVTLLGVIFSVSLLLISLFTFDAVDFMMDEYFNEGQSYDIAIRFDSLLSESELLNISRLDGVQKVESFMEIPVRIHYGGRTEDEVLLAYGPDLTMKRLETDTGQSIRVPEAGIVLNDRTARKLGINSGAEVEVETLLPTGPVHRDQVAIVGLCRQLVGAGSYVNLQQANRLLNERNLVSGALLRIEPGKVIQVEGELNRMLGIASILSSQKEIDNFNKNLESMNFSLAIMVLFAALLGFAIVYNSSVMNLAERQREIGSMRVIGYSVGEVSAMLFKENVVHAIMGVILGLPTGLYMAQAYVQSASTDMYSLPVVIYPRTYVLAAIGTILFIVAAHLFSVRGIKSMDLVSVLKSPD